MTRHRHLAQRVDALDALTSDPDPPELRRLFWLAHASMGISEPSAARARALAEQCAPLPSTWPPREVYGDPEGEP
jgi:hypothetical protein